MSRHDAQIKRLTEHPDQIRNEWIMCNGLFARVGEAGSCLTQIRLGGSAFIKGKFNVKLTKEIFEDERLPYNAKEIIPEQHLPVFVEWWTKIDKLQNS